MLPYIPIPIILFTQTLFLTGWFDRGCINDQTGGSFAKQSTAMKGERG